MSMDGPSDERILHPFFENTRASHSSLIDKTCSDAVSTSHNVSSVPSNTTPSTAVDPEVTAPPPQRLDRVKPRKRRKDRSQLQLVPATGALVAHAVPAAGGLTAVEATFKPQVIKRPRKSTAKRHVEPSSDCETTAPAVNNGQQKRRRTFSPNETRPYSSPPRSPAAASSVGINYMKANDETQPMSLHQQLEAAATTPSPTRQEEKILVPASSPTEDGSCLAGRSKKLPSTPFKVLDSPPRLKSDSDTTRDTGRRLTRKRSRVALTRITMKSRTPTPVKPVPKKVDLGALGKLMAPKASKEIPFRVREKSHGRRTKETQVARQLIVVLKVGAENAVRLDSDAAVETSRDATRDVVRYDVPVPSPVVIEAPKAPHPFFLGKMIPKCDDDHRRGRLGERSGISSPSRVDRKSISPRRKATPWPTFSSTTMPKKPRQIVTPNGIALPWPSRESMHVRGLSTAADNDIETMTTPDLAYPTAAGLGTKKLKDAAIVVPRDEDILEQFAARLNRLPLTTLDLPTDRVNSSTLRLPRRSLTTSRDLKRQVRQRLWTRIEWTDDLSEDELQSRSSQDTPPHAALQKLFKSIGHSLPPFDTAECETQSWVQKYAPRCATDVLQVGPEPTLLKSWLQLSVITSVGVVLSAPATVSKRMRGSDVAKKKPKKRRKKSDDELAGFIIKSDEEDEEMDEISELDDNDSEPMRKRTVIRSSDLVAPARTAEVKKVTNAILISGPHGSGKSAAAHAVAKELGFEVFEINPGNRRSGKDILDQVGDMTRNHLVQHGSGEHDEAPIEDDTSLDTESLRRDIESGRQGTMNTFFKAPPKEGKQPQHSRASKVKRPKTTAAPKPSEEMTRRQKQSVILLEEVDVLFEEDKQFWATVIALIAQSKRPVIMTCNDESLVPLEELSLHAILRFEAPPRELSVDYLLLLVANEGHLLRRPAVDALYRAKGGDLRASLMELDFWCQMAVGDTKGGLEWMYERWPPERTINEHGERIRIASSDTYLAGMGWLTHSTSSEGVCDTVAEAEFRREIWSDWEIDIESWHDIKEDRDLQGRLQDGGSRSAAECLATLQSSERAIEAMSAADVCVGHALPVNYRLHLDSSHPPTHEKVANDTVQGHHQIDAEPDLEYDALSTQILLYIRTIARKNFVCDLAQQFTIAHNYKPLQPSDLVTRIAYRSKRPQGITSQTFDDAFLPLSFPPKSQFSSIQPQMHSLHLNRSPLSIIATDFAPYIRSVIRYDSVLAMQRSQMSTLLSQGKYDGKVPRKTRSSRSAMEGGERRKTRRDFWWDEGRRPNPVLVERTGGRNWAELVLRSPANQTFHTELGTKHSPRNASSSEDNSTDESSVMSLE